MEMIPVSSGNITSIGYDRGTRTLRIEFLRGGIYDYNRVPPDVFENFLSAASKGIFFDRFIKNGGYPFVRL